jgi:hypothetical protein
MKMFENLSPRKKLFQQIISVLLILGAALCIYQPEYHALRVFTRYAPQITIGYWLLGLFFLAIYNARLTMLSFICCGFLLQKHLKTTYCISVLPKLISH